MITSIISNISWDTEDNGKILSPEVLNLPKTVQLDHRMSFRGSIADRLSDMYGYCVKGYQESHPLWWTEKECDHREVNTNLGMIPVEDFLEIYAFQHGFDSYEDVRKKNNHIKNVTFVFYD